MKKKITFEQALERLEEISALLEQGNTPLEEALKLYEEAAALAADCQKQLSDVQVRIAELSEVSGESAAGSEEENEEVNDG